MAKTLHKKDPIAGVFLWIVQKYSEQLFCRMLNHSYGILSFLYIGFRKIYIMLANITRNAQFSL